MMVGDILKYALLHDFQKCVSVHFLKQQHKFVMYLLLVHIGAEPFVSRANMM